MKNNKLKKAVLPPDSRPILDRLRIGQQEAKTVQAVIDFIFENPDIFAHFDILRNQWGRNYPIEFAFSSISFTGNFNIECSNSHGAPAGKLQNWHRKSDKPVGYPGYEGKIEYSVYGRPTSKYSSFGFRCFEGSGIHTGSGGGSKAKRLILDEVEYEQHDYHFGAIIWLDDWIGLKDDEELNNYIDRQIINKLNGGKYIKPPMITATRIFGV